jgi:hypothetical protein
MSRAKPSPVLLHALSLARDWQRLAEACGGLTFELDRGLPSAGNDGELSRLAAERDAALQRFDAFLLEVGRQRDAQWPPYLTQVAAALLALVSSEPEAQWLVQPWQLAASGATPAGFAGSFLEGVRLVDRNYRLLMRSGMLPQGFPRLPEGSA